MSKNPNEYKPGKDGVTFLPLGGCGQFGANFNLYGYDGKWMIVDCGIAFADERLPGVDILLPDPAFIEKQKKNLLGLVITHAHEDHIGAVARVWPRLECPIYATPFAACVLRKKFIEYPPQNGKPEIIEIDARGTEFDLEPVFKLKTIPVCHSIPEAFSLAIETKAGKVLHSGDWNLDPTPVIGKPTDEKAFQALADQNILAYIGDSTNAGVEGFSKSESEIAPGFTKLFAQCKNRIAVTLFSSNIARVINIHKAASANGRSVCLAGRALSQMVNHARECGYIPDSMRFVDLDQAESLPTDQIVYVVTGSQGEGRAALAKIAKGAHHQIKFSRGDTVFFSARTIPGNERAILDMKNMLLDGGIAVFDPDSVGDETIHVSGHPRKGEVEQMLNWVKPKALIAVHGERVQQSAHAKMHANAIAPENGQIMLIKPDGQVDTKGFVESGLQVVDFDRIVDLDHAAVSQRRKMSFNGAVMVSLVYDTIDDDILDLQVTTLGLLDLDHAKDQKYFEDLEEHIDRAITKMPVKDRRKPAALEDKIRSYVKRYFRELFDVRPLVEIHITLLD